MGFSIKGEGAVFERERGVKGVSKELELVESCLKFYSCKVV